MKRLLLMIALLSANVHAENYQQADKETEISKAMVGCALYVGVMNPQDTDTEHRFMKEAAKHYFKSIDLLDLKQSNEDTYVYFASFAAAQQAVLWDEPLNNGHTGDKIAAKRYYAANCPLILDSMSK
ncbi:hypothetical protein CMS34_22940 [Salmonella enterica]|nr:hypothetical protein [Salmonella enterica]